jgi:hypothetical protein
MNQPKPRNRDTKGTLARVDRNVAIAQCAGMRLRAVAGDNAMLINAYHLGDPLYLEGDERQARSEMSPGLWLKSYVEGWNAVGGRV